jgi:tRNA (guanine-N7-)-methyltransferase
MTVTQARSIITNQTCVHEDLIKILAKHKQSDFKRPVAEHTIVAFAQMLHWLTDWRGDVIIDACCGVGESTINLANEYPAARVIGVDKSVARLDKHRSYVTKNKSLKALMVNSDSPIEQINIETEPKNYLLLQADLNDFWRLLLEHISQMSPAWKIVKQFILYPNPYPKKSQLGKRWHGGALFPYIVNLCSNIEVRSNWRLYLDEFLIAAEFYGLIGDIEPISEKVIDKAYTPFERKYLAANQTCFKLVIRP